MTREALYVEDRCKIPVWDESTQLWHVRYYVNHSWYNSSFPVLKDATAFYHLKYEELREEYRKTHETYVSRKERQLSLKFGKERE